MKKLLLTTTVLLFTLIGVSQEKIEYTSNDELNAKVNKFSEEEKYDLVLEILNKISPNDSIYDSKLVSKSYYLMELDKYQEALDVLEEGLFRNDMVNRHSFYVNKSICHIKLGEDEKAIENWDRAIEEYPMNSDFFYRKGIYYSSIEKDDKALLFFKEALKRNPFDPNIFLKLGNICWKQQLTTQALMCFDMYLLLNPEGEDAFAVLNSLNNVLSQDNKQTKTKGFKVSKDDDDFEELDMILDARIAMSEKYKISNPINIAFTKQNHVLFEKLNEIEGSGGLWSEKFVPFYKWMVENKHFDSFIYTTTYSIKNEKYKKIVNKKLKEINAFIPVFKDKWEEIMQSNMWDVDGELKEVSSNFYERRLEGLGIKKNGNLVGNWQFYDNKGRPSSTGSFDEEGKRIGVWVWQYKNGKVKETANYSEGVLTGENVEYYKNENVKYKALYVNDTLNGNYKLYNDNGALEQDKTFKKGVLDGQYTSYHEAGLVAPKYLIKFKEGLQDGVFDEKIGEGNKIYTVLKKDGNKEDLEKRYYDNGAIKSTYEYKNDLFEGEYKFYFKNGKIKISGLGIEGDNSGEWKEYYSNGTLREKYNYVKGKLHGVSSEYSPNKKLSKEFMYRKGELIGYKFFNTSGEILKEGKKKGGEFFYEGYSVNGSIVTQGLYDVKGGKEGEWRFYSSNGILDSKTNYKSGLANGESLDYYGNGNVKTRSFYKTDVLQGYQVNYFKNEQISSQGYLADGFNDKEWRSYFKDGALYAINYYHKGKLNGTQKYYTVDGKLEKNVKYTYGSLISEESFGNDKQVLNVFNYENMKGEKTFKSFYKEGKVFEEMNYLNGVLHGSYIKYNFFGDVILKANYVNGKASGSWVFYHSNKKESVQVSYINGERNGVYKRYYQNGNLKEESLYDLGDLMTSILYTEDGKTVRSKSILTEEGRHRKRYSYSENGKLQLIRIYEFGRLIGYSYHNENGEELPMIAIEKETAKIVSYFDNGKKARALEYVNGALENEYLQYYYSGKLHEKKNFKLNDFEGVSVKYYENGNVKEEISYLSDDFHGLRKKYFKNGKLKEETSYKNDEKSGPAKYYNISGEKLRTEHYFNNKISRIEE